MEVTIVTVSWRGLETARRLEKKLAPLVPMLDEISDEDTAFAAAWLKRKVAEFAQLERDLRAKGL